jgi:hypothetical protein
MPAVSERGVTMDRTIEARILARWSDDPLESPLTVDVRLHAQRRRIVGHWPLFGAVGLGTPACRPFVLEAGGRLDFGEGRAGPERFWQTDMREREIAVGASFRMVWSGGDAGSYVIEKIAVLGSKAG